MQKRRNRVSDPFLTRFGSGLGSGYRIDLPVDEVTVSVDEGTGKSVFIGRKNWACLYRYFGVR